MRVEKLLSQTAVDAPKVSAVAINFISNGKAERNGRRSCRTCCILGNVADAADEEVELSNNVIAMAHRLCHMQLMTKICHINVD